MNTFGKYFRLTTFGESHGVCIGGVVDGFPAGVTIDTTYIQHELDRRRPGQSALTTPRKEADRIEILSGVYEGVSTGCPIGFIVRNEQQHSADYDNLKNLFRPSHADFTYTQKYGTRDHRGGGRSSARETIARCVGGAFAKLFLRSVGIEITAYTAQVGHIALPGSYNDYDLSQVESNAVRCPDAATAQEMAQYILDVKAKGDTIGGIIACVIKGCPCGLGAPVFGKLHAALGAAMLSINAAKGFDYGSGFDGVALKGSESNDYFEKDENGNIRTRTNRSGGIQGGISNGNDIYFRVAFKPIATLLQEQPTVDIHGEETVVKARGRHDACVLPRAVPIVEAMAAMTLMDYYLENRLAKV